MDMSFLMDYVNVIAVGICLCLGFILKAWEKAPNQAIPTIIGIVGVVVMLWVHGWSATPEIVLTGLISGLASTGMYEAFKQYIEKAEKKEVL